MDHTQLRQAIGHLARRILRQMLFHMPLAEAQQLWDELSPEQKPQWVELWKREAARRRDAALRQHGLGPNAGFVDLVSEDDGWAALYSMSAEQSRHVGNELVRAAKRRWDGMGPIDRTKVMLELRGPAGGGGSWPRIEPQQSGLITDRPPTDGGFEWRQGQHVWNIDRGRQPIDQPLEPPITPPSGGTPGGFSAGGASLPARGDAPPQRTRATGPVEASVLMSSPGRSRRRWGRAVLVNGVVAGALATWHRRGRRQKDE